MSSYEDSALQFVKAGVRSVGSMGRFTFAGATHRMQWNENPYDFPADLKEEVLRRMAERAWSHYPNSLRPFELIDQLADLYNLPPEMIVVNSGSASLIKMVMEAVLEPGDHMMMLSPTFLLYRRNASLLGAELHEVPALPETDFSLPVNGLVVGARTNEAKLVALCAPNNPTGTVYTIDQVRRVVDESGALVIVDEAYVEFSDSDMLPLIEEFENVILLRTFSKAYGMAGMRVGYALAPQSLAKELDKSVSPFPISTFSETAALTALEHRDRFMENVARTIKERTRLSAALSALPGVHVYSSGANFILTQLERPPQPLVAELREDHGVVLSDMASYPELPQTVRISIGMPEANDIVIGAYQKFVEEE